VLPFANLTGDDEQEYLSEGLTEELIAQLGRLHPRQLDVIARSSVMPYKGGRTPADRVGRELGVDFVVEGSAGRDADRVRVTAALVNARDLTRVWSATYEREPTELPGLQAEVAREVARRVDIPPARDREPPAPPGRAVNPEVYEACLRGAFYTSQNTKEAFEKGIRYLHRAVELDPADPRAYARLAEGYITMGHGSFERREAFVRAKAAAEQALALQPDIAEAVGVLAHVALYYDWDWARAEQLFEQALALNPSLAMTHYHYAWYLALFDRQEEAIAEHTRARDLDPLRALHSGWLGALYNYVGRHDDAIASAMKGLEIDPRFWPSYQVIANACSAKGLHQDAIAAATRMAELEPVRGTLRLSVAFARAGDRARAREEYVKVQAQARGLHYGAAARLALGDREGALQDLEAAFEAHPSSLPWVRVRGGGFDELRDEPRFQALLRRMNLPR
jgi:TolB-like protein/tetratricopeptide (TPR) repeat protein